MWLDSLLGTNKSRRQPRHHRHPPRPARCGARLSLEQLESRTVLSAYMAASAADLIADINAANAAGGANTITLAPAVSPYLLTAVNNTTNGATGLPVITVGDNLTIVGNADTIERSSASGTPAFRMLDVATGASLTLDNLTLEGGLAQGAGSKVSTEGGGICNQGTLTLDGVAIENNVAQGTYLAASANAYGGAIYSTGALVLEGGTVMENDEALGVQASPPPPRNAPGNGINGGYAYGGALYVAGGTATITNSTASANTAQGGQGQSVFTNIGGSGGWGFGGAIYVANGTTSVTLTGDTFASNAARGGAGGGSRPNANWSGVPLALSGIPGGSAVGGALAVYGGTLSDTACNFSFNTAVGGQGGGCLPLVTTTIGGHGGSANGGAIYALEPVSLSGGILSSNSAIGGQGGGGLLNIAGPGGEASGGGANIVGGRLTAVTITGNEAAGGAGGSAYFGGAGGPASGGGLYLGLAGAGLTGLTVTNNDATGGAGGSGEINGAAGSAFGGGIYVAGGQVTITTTNVNNNQAVTPNGQSGGGIYIAIAKVPSVYLDSYTVANVVNNTASVGPNIDGLYTKLA